MEGGICCCYPLAPCEEFLVGWSRCPEHQMVEGAAGGALKVLMWPYFTQVQNVYDTNYKQRILQLALMIIIEFLWQRVCEKGSKVK